MCHISSAKLPQCYDLNQDCLSHPCHCLSFIAKKKTPNSKVKLNCTQIKLMYN